MIISVDSPLRRLPSQLNRKQTLFFDGIRYSVEMADLAYQRLQSTLLGMQPDKNETESEHLSFASAVLDAWSIIDSIYRLRSLLNQAPGVKQKAPVLRIFLEKTADIEHLRNSIQHLNTQIETLLNQNLPVWGVLSWVTMRDPEKQTAFTCALIAGTASPSQGHTMVNPAGKAFVPPIDLITLTASGYSVSLSQVMRQEERLTRSIEEKLRDQFAALPQAGGDLFV